MEDIIKQLTITIRNGIPAACRVHFDEALTHSMSKHTALEQLNGIKPYQKLAVIENAVEITSERCNELEHKHNDIQFYAVKPLFHALKQMSKQSHASIKEIKTKLSPDDHKHDKTAAESPKPKQDTLKQNSKAKPSSTSARIGTRPDESKVYRELDSYKTKGNPFRSLTHINCDSAACGFCLGLYSHVNLTQCVGHKKCVPSGWFPHVGKALWSKLKRTHDSGVEYTGRTQTVREHELPALVNRSNFTNQQIDEMDAETASTISQTDINSEVMSELSRSKSGSPDAEGSVSSRSTLKSSMKHKSSRGTTPKRMSPAKSRVILLDMDWHTGKSSKPVKSDAISSNQ